MSMPIAVIPHSRNKTQQASPFCLGLMIISPKRGDRNNVSAPHNHWLGKLQTTIAL